VIWGVMAHPLVDPEHGLDKPLLEVSPLSFEAHLQRRPKSSPGRLVMDTLVGAAFVACVLSIVVSGKYRLVTHEG
jgi:L-arabinose isomerase